MNIHEPPCHALFMLHCHAAVFCNTSEELSMNSRWWIVALASAVALNVSAEQSAGREFAAELRGHALLPASTTVAPPRAAPATLATSGKYTGKPGERVETMGTLPGNSFLADKAAPRLTGHTLPMRGQPVQGFSGIKPAGGGAYWVIADNGFGSKANSSDAMLAMHRVRPDWKSGVVKLERTVFLSDPNRKLPFVIVNEGTKERFLTGADLDTESMQIVGDTVWLGDEFGPFLVSADMKGQVTGVYGTVVDGKPVRSPDHPSVSMPAVPGAVSFEARRSRGYEGMAASKDGRFLYPLLEGPLWDGKGWEMKEGREVLRILEFDIAARAFTQRSWKYVLEANGNNIGDFNMIDADTALIIERDNGEGDPSDACTGAPQPTCQNVPAKFKRIYKIDLSQADADGVVKKVGYIDLMNIADPKGVAKRGSKAGRFTFPFVTIEDIDVVDSEHIIVANDNNYPYSMGRALGKQDDNEFILLHVPELLKAR
jgi:hypothetical protein